MTWCFVLYTSVFKLFDKAISCFNEWSMLHTNGIYKKKCCVRATFLLILHCEI